LGGGDSGEKQIIWGEDVELGAAALLSVGTPLGTWLVREEPSPVPLVVGCVSDDPSSKFDAMTDHSWY
jgi:hypothetical protein